MADAVIIHTSEICLKGGSRRSFEDRLISNIRERVSDVGSFGVSQRQGSVVLKHDAPLSREQIGRLERRLRTVFGISHFIFADSCEASIEAIHQAAAAVADRQPAGSFKAETSRSDKDFPLKSPEVSRLVGAYVLARRSDLRVDVHEPGFVLDIEIHKHKAFVSAERRSGWGGLPVGTAGKVAVLLSGGIDSPVAAWKVMRRGCQTVFVHFHSYPYVGRGSIDKAERLARLLGDYQGPANLYLVPLADAQRAITDKAEPALRVVLYRRMMLRIAELAARSEKALGLVTGDSIGQVASQTLENLAAVSAATALPIYRPLAGDNKEEVIDLAKKIGTFNVSIEPHDDCCSLFQPPRPATRATLEAVLRQEKLFDTVALAAAAWSQTEKKPISGHTWDVEAAAAA